MADGSRYEGGWRDGMRHGHGTRVWADGRRYQGEWRDDTYFTGVATLPDGDRVEWRNGDPVSD